MPYYAIFPVLDKTDTFDTHHSFDIVRENDNLRNYVSEKMSDGKPFIIPRIAGVENNLRDDGSYLHTGLQGES